MAYHLILGLIFFAVVAAVNPHTTLTSGFFPLASRSGYKALTDSRERPAFRSLGEGGTAEAQEEREPAPGPFHDIQLEARNVYVLDMRTGELMYEKNSLEPRPLASLTKLLTAVLVEEHVPGRVYIPLSPEAIRQDEGEGLEAGDKLEKSDLVDFMLVASSNDAAYAAAEFIGASLEGNGKANVSKFVALMNERARDIGMLSSSFLNPHGLDVTINFKRISGADGSAFDVAVLLDYILKNYPHLLAATREGGIQVISEKGKTYTARNTDEALGILPQLIGAKTGATKLAGGNLAFVFDAGFERPVLAVILGASEEGRFEDAEKIEEAALKYIQWY